MTVKKTFLKSKNKCRVTFACPEENASQVCVVGDFNEWDTAATPMKKGKNGFSATLELDPGKKYEFRYLVDGNRWINDEDADDYAPTPYQDCQNCVLVAERVNDMQNTR